MTVQPWKIGTHHHLSDNVADLGDTIDAAIAAAGSALPAGGTTGQALVKDSNADGDASWHDISGSGSPDLSLYGPLFSLTPPVDGDYAWVNQGGASVATDTQGIFLLAPIASGTNLRIRKKAAPSTPYTVTAVILPALFGINFTSCGLVFRQSSSGKLHVLNIVHNSGTFFLNSEAFNSPTSFSQQYVNASRFWGGPAFLRIADNGTNRICSWSVDGVNWLELHSVSRTDFLTADEVGFYAASDQTTWPAGVKLISWLEA